MTKGAKGFPQVRIDAEGKRGGDAAPAAPRRDERARAAAYLDLWERRLTHLALDGPDPAPWPPD